MEKIYAHHLRVFTDDTGAGGWSLPAFSFPEKERVDENIGRT